MDEEAEAMPNEAMNGVRLSAAEKGKRKVADGDADLLPPAPDLVLQSAGGGEPQRSAGDAAACAGGVGLPRHLLLQPCGTSEIEELPPSPPRGAPSSRLQQLLREMEAALDSRLRKLEQLRELEQLLREMKEGAKATRRRDAGADDEPVPEVGGGAEAQEAEVSGMSDAMLAFRLQAEEMEAMEEFWKPVVPGCQPQRNHSKAELEQMKALEEFWKPVVPVSRLRNNNKRHMNWKEIISFIALTRLTSWLVPYISLWWTLLPVNLTHIVGAIFVLWILRSTYSYCQRFRTSRTISRHVPRLIYMCFWLLVLYVLYLILRTIHGAFPGLLGKHQ